MKFIIYYNKEIARLGGVLKNSIRKKWKRIDIEVFENISSIKKRIERCDSFDNDIYIFLIDSKRRLLEITNYNHLTEDKKLILIVPDESEEIMRLSIKLYPRYITKISDSYEDLNLVLEKMIKDSTFVKTNIHNQKIFEQKSTREIVTTFKRSY